ncbi:helix-turn-helix domain-containing protein [Peribacillus muralis]|uniref:helix-turn-helix domain-containing protein n=1 Tax=Peribacillus muralis TaxID=264697 RepID=UPI003D022E0E
MERSNNIIGERLKFIRKSKKIKVDTITDFLDIARSTYNGYEAGTRRPDSGKLVKLSKLMNTSIDFLTGKTDIQTPTNDLREILSSNELIYNGNKITEYDREMISRLVDSLLKQDKN